MNFKKRYITYRFFQNLSDADKANFSNWTTQFSTYSGSSNIIETLLAKLNNATSISPIISVESFLNPTKVVFKTLTYALEQTLEAKAYTTMLTYGGDLNQFELDMLQFLNKNIAEVTPKDYLNYLLSLKNIEILSLCYMQKILIRDNTGEYFCANPSTNPAERSFSFRKPSKVNPDKYYVYNYPYTIPIE